MNSPGTMLLLQNLNALVGGLFLLAAFGLVATRQVQGCVRLFAALSVLLGLSALLLSAVFHAWHLAVIGIVDIVTKAIVIPLILWNWLRGEVYTRREVNQVLNIPTALLLALGLAVAADFIARPLVALAGGGPVTVNLPIGLAGVLVGGLTSAVRREAVPLFLGLLAMENSAFLIGLAVAPEMPLVADVSIAFDVLILVFVMSILTRTVRQRVGTTEVGGLTVLREESPR